MCWLNSTPRIAGQPALMKTTNIALVSTRSNFNPRVLKNSPFNSIQVFYFSRFECVSYIVLDRSWRMHLPIAICKRWNNLLSHLQYLPSQRTTCWWRWNRRGQVRNNRILTGWQKSDNRSLVSNFGRFPNNKKGCWLFRGYRNSRSLQKSKAPVGCDVRSRCETDEDRACCALATAWSWPTRWFRSLSRCWPGAFEHLCIVPHVPSNDNKEHGPMIGKSS